MYVYGSFEIQILNIKGLIIAFKSIIISTKISIKMSYKYIKDIQFHV